MADGDAPHVNLRKALKKLGPVQVNVNQAQRGLRALPDEPQVPLADECSAIMADIVRLKERLIKAYERLGGEWHRA